MKRSWLKEDKLPSKLIVNFSSKINGYIKDVSDLNQNNVEALSQWSDYIEGIKSYLSNPVIAWDNMNRYPRLRNGGRVIKDFDYNAGYTILADYVTGQPFVYVFMLNLKPEEFGLQVPTNRTEAIERAVLPILEFHMRLSKIK